jgi:hypothetical protein
VGGRVINGKGLPADQPFCNIYKGDKGANDTPIYGVFLEISLIYWALREHLEGGIAGEKKSKPGA